MSPIRPTHLEVLELCPRRARFALATGEWPKKAGHRPESAILAQRVRDLVKEPGPANDLAGLLAERARALGAGGTHPEVELTFRGVSVWAYVREDVFLPRAELLMVSTSERPPGLDPEPGDGVREGLALLGLHDRLGSGAEIRLRFAHLRTETVTEREATPEDVEAMRTFFGRQIDTLEKFRSPSSGSAAPANPGSGCVTCPFSDGRCEAHATWLAEHAAKRVREEARAPEPTTFAEVAEARDQAAQLAAAWEARRKDLDAMLRDLLGGEKSREEGGWRAVRVETKRPAYAPAALVAAAQVQAGGRTDTPEFAVALAKLTSACGKVDPKKLRKALSPEARIAADEHLSEPVSVSLRVSRA